MKIEILFPEVANLYGDLFNIRYLKQCLPEVEIVSAHLDTEPAFVTEHVNMIYMGPMTEKSQELVIEKLLPYKEKIEEMIENNIIFLITGNALEIFGLSIEKEDGTIIKGLGIFPTKAKRTMFKRYNSMFLGEYKDIEIVGFKNQFSHSYGDVRNSYFCETIRGDGLNEDTKREGIAKNNFIATYLLGPILILNPLFTKKILRLLKNKRPNLAFEEESMYAYLLRLREFKNDSIKLK